MASKTLLMLALLCASPLVSAQTVGALSDLQSETIMIKAKAEQEKARASLLEAKGAPPHRPLQTQSPCSWASSAVSARSMPVLLWMAALSSKYARATRSSVDTVWPS